MKYEFRIFIKDYDGDRMKAFLNNTRIDNDRKSINIMKNFTKSINCTTTHRLNMHVRYGENFISICGHFDDAISFIENAKPGKITRDIVQTINRCAKEEFTDEYCIHYGYLDEKSIFVQVMIDKAIHPNHFISILDSIAGYYKFNKPNCIMHGTPLHEFGEIRSAYKFKNDKKGDV